MDAQAQCSPEKSKDKNKGKSGKNQNKAKAKTGEVNFVDEDQDEVDGNTNVNQEDAKACEAIEEFSDGDDFFGYVADWDVSDARAASVPQKPVNDTWEWRGPCCLVRVHRQPRKTLFTPTWNGLKIRPVTQAVRTTVAQPVGSDPLKPYVEKVNSKILTKKDFRPRKVAHLRTGETRFQVAPHVQGNTLVKIPAKLMVPAGDLPPVAIADSGASRVILPSTALNTNNKDNRDCDIAPGSW